MSLSRRVLGARIAARHRRSGSWPVSRRGYPAFRGRPVRRTYRAGARFFPPVPPPGASPGPAAQDAV